ncbi:hypothetical protein DL767_001516 [Monosporascus sp. MG133]|nr:hypothetical protein DL767_001516 [Monosporascus sp. MG133]
MLAPELVPLTLSYLFRGLFVGSQRHQKLGYHISDLIPPGASPVDLLRVPVPGPELAKAITLPRGYAVFTDQRAAKDYSHGEPPDDVEIAFDRSGTQFHRSRQLFGYDTVAGPGVGTGYYGRSIQVAAYLERSPLGKQSRFTIDGEIDQLQVPHMRAQGSNDKYAHAAATARARNRVGSGDHTDIQTTMLRLANSLLDTRSHRIPKADGAEPDWILTQRTKLDTTVFDYCVFRRPLRKAPVPKRNSPETAFSERPGSPFDQQSVPGVDLRYDGHASLAAVMGTQVDELRVGLDHEWIAVTLAIALNRILGVHGPIMARLPTKPYTHRPQGLLGALPMSYQVIALKDYYYQADDLERQEGYVAAASWLAMDADNEAFGFRKFDQLSAVNQLHMQSWILEQEKRLDDMHLMTAQAMT